MPHPRLSAKQSEPTRKQHVLTCGSYGSQSLTAPSPSLRRFSYAVTTTNPFPRCVPRDIPGTALTTEKEVLQYAFACLGGQIQVEIIGKRFS